MKVEHSQVKIVLVSSTTHLGREASTCTRIPTDSRDGESPAILMTKERVTMKQIVSGLDHHWSSSAPLLMREYLHAAANNLVGFIKMDAVDKWLTSISRAQQLRESGMNWCYG